jgi:hypothetical protein
VQEEVLPRPADKSDAFLNISRAAVKSTVAGLAGATLTNPFDVIRYLFILNQNICQQTGWISIWSLSCMYYIIPEACCCMGDLGSILACLYAILDIHD